MITFLFVSMFMCIQLVDILVLFKSKIEIESRLYCIDIYDDNCTLPVIPGSVMYGNKDQSVVPVVPVLTVLVVTVEPVIIGLTTDTMLEISLDATKHKNILFKNLNLNSHAIFCDLGKNSDFSKTI